MKLLAAFMVLFLRNIFAETSVNSYDDFTKVECSSSGKTCLNPYCFLGTTDQLNNSLSFGCDLQRNLAPVYFHIKLMKYENSNYELVSDKTINFCHAEDHPQSYNYDFHGSIKFKELTFPELIQECPYTTIRITNGTRTFMDSCFPNGKYKTITTIMDDSDDKIFEIIFYEDLFMSR